MEYKLKQISTGGIAEAIGKAELYRSRVRAGLTERRGQPRRPPPNNLFAIKFARDGGPLFGSETAQCGLKTTPSTQKAGQIKKVAG